MQRRVGRAPKRMDVYGAKQRGVEKGEGALCSAVGQYSIGSYKKVNIHLQHSNCDIVTQEMHFSKYLY